MPSSPVTENLGVYPTTSYCAPPEGPRTIPLSLNFSQFDTWLLDLVLIRQQAKLTRCQGLFIDNSANTQALTIHTDLANQQVIVPAGWQGYSNILCNDTPNLKFSSAGGSNATVHLTNFRVSDFLWPVNGAFPIVGDVTVIQGTSPWVVDGTVNVGNFPAIQPVSGTVTANQGGAPWHVDVDNFPAVQTVNVNNFPTTQPISGSVSVSNFPATQPVSGTVAVSNFPATQPVSGSVSVSNFPATQTVAGTVTANQGGAPWSDNLTQVGGSAISLGQKAMSASIPVTMASNQNAMAIATGQITGTTAVTIGTSAFTSIKAIYVLSLGATLAAGVVELDIVDSTGTRVLRLNVPTFAAAPTTISPIEIFDIQLLDVPLATGAGSLTANLTTNLTSGSFFVYVPVH